MDKKLRIIYVATSVSSEDGFGRYSKSIAETVATVADVKILICKNAKNEITDRRVDVFKVLPDKNLDLSGRLAHQAIVQFKIFYRLLRFARDCDIVHALAEPFAPAAAFASFLVGARFVMTLHGNYAVPPKKWWSPQRIAMQYAYRRAAITTSGSLGTERRAREIVDFGECRFIPNGVDSRIFHVLPDTKKGEYLLTVGALRPRKGADILIQALGLLKDDFPNLRCKLVGKTRDAEFADYLRNLIGNFGLKHKVEFCGEISDKELVRLYNECLIFILAAKETNEGFEGFPMVFYEANACGAPVISTKGFGSEYAIRDGVNGYLIDRADPALLAAAIKKILSDKNARRRLNHGAIQEAAGHTWGKILPQIMQLYKDALS